MGKLPSYLSAPEIAWYYTLRVLCVLILVFLLVPVFVIVPLSFSDSSLLLYPIQRFSLRWYEVLFQSSEWRRAAKNSFIIAPAATVLATVLGTLAAAGLHGMQFRGKELLTAILISPMIVPLVVTGLGIYLFFAPYGLANSYLAMILALAAIGVPFPLITVSATLQGFDQNLVRAGYSLGAKPWQAFRDITLPTIAPGVIAGALFAFAVAFDEIVITLFLAGPEQVTLPRQMFTGIRENISPVIAALATVLVLFSTSLLLVLEWLRQRSETKRTTG